MAANLGPGEAEWSRQDNILSSQIVWNNLQDLSRSDGCAGTLGSTLCNGLDFRAGDDKRPADGVVSETLTKISICEHLG